MKISSLLKKKKVYTPIIVVLLIGGFVFVQSKKTPVPEFSSQLVERIDLTQTVSETGSVEASLDLVYGWETSGKVIEILKHVGDNVTSTDVIARLGSEQQKARYNEAAALLASAQARLNLELAGPSDEVQKKNFAVVKQAEAALAQSKANLTKVEAQSSASVASAEKAVETAKNNLQLVADGEDSELVNDAYADLVNTMKSATTNLGNALTIADNILGIDNTLANNTFENVLSVVDMSTLYAANSSYAITKSKKVQADTLVGVLSASDDHTAIDMAYTSVHSALGAMQTLLLNVQRVLVATRALGNLTQTALDTLKSGVTTVQGAIDTSATGVTNGNQAIASARNSLTSYTIAYSKALSDLEQTKKQTDADIAVAEAQVSAQEANVVQAQASYNDLVAPPRNVDVASLRADVSRQAANLSTLRDELKKTDLVALATGMISKLDVEVGENVTINQEVVGILANGFTIKVDISESDVAKLSLNDSVHITLDAYGENVPFSGTVVKIEPGETEISGVVYYKTTILFDDIPSEYDVRSGMTVNVDIQTDIREQVLVIPRRAVLTKDGTQFVRVVKNKEKGIFEERTVETGLAGDDGLVEITSGLNEGDDVVTFLKES